MSDIYEAPKSNLVSEPEVPQGYGSIEKGVSGDYQFRIGEVISEAWEKTSGAKGSILLGFLLYIVVLMVVSIPMELVQNNMIESGAEPSSIMMMAIISQLVINLVVLPIAVGFFILGIRRSVNAPLEATSIFRHFKKTLSLFITMLLMYLMIILGLILLVVPGIYLMIGYFLAMPLVVEKGLGPWQALEVSRKTITHRWFSVFVFSLFLTIILMISMIPLGIGLIWTLPFMMIAYGILYRNMFGVETETLK